MTQVEVDFNSIVRDGLLRGSARYADGPLSVGLRVDLVDLEDPEMSFTGRVVEFDEHSQRALFAVDWEPVHETYGVAYIVAGSYTTGASPLRVSTSRVASGATWGSAVSVLV